MEKIKLKIQGMTCSSCQSHVQRALEDIEGVKNVNVNLLSGSASLEYDKTICNISDLIKVVKDAGYEASYEENSSYINKEKKIDSDILEKRKRIIISSIFLILIMIISFVNMILKNMFSPLIINILQFILLLPVLYVNRAYFIVGYKRLFKFSPNMDSLIAIGSSASVIYGLFSVIMLIKSNAQVADYYNNTYFESAAMILTLITIGKYIESKSKGKTKDAISKLIDLTPKTAIVIKNGIEVVTKVDEIEVGDIIIIKPGSIIPVDGEVIDGKSYVDESSITGESVAVSKTVKDKVIAGTLNKNGAFTMKALKVKEDTMLAQIIKLVEEASNSKAPISKMVDRVSFYFVPIVILISIITLIVWFCSGATFDLALNFAISVLVISCPCALGLATPIAIMVGTTKAAKSGILVKSAEEFENLEKVDLVVLDKTGTLTEGKPKISSVVTKIPENEFIKILASLEKNSQHLIAEAILEYATEKGIDNYLAKEFKNISGRGIQAKIENEMYYAGNLEYMKDLNIDIEENVQEDGTIVYLSNSKQYLGYVIIKDKLKKESKKLVENLKNENIEVMMLTGDNEKVARNVAYDTNINRFCFNMLPKNKADEIKKNKKFYNKIVFVGDGINDSVALTTADVGIAIGSGTDIAVEAADIILINNNLMDVHYIINLSKNIMNNIKMNLFWAFFYNVLSIPIAAGVLYNSYSITLNPAIASIAMSLSSLCVVTNALRIKKFKIKEENVERLQKEIIVDGMQCNHCKMTIEKVLSSIDGVEKVEVDLETKKVIITSNKEIPMDVIKKNIESEGFSIN